MWLALFAATAAMFFFVEGSGDAPLALGFAAVSATVKTIVARAHTAIFRNVRVKERNVVAVSEGTAVGDTVQATFPKVLGENLGGRVMCDVLPACHRLGEGAVDVLPYAALPLFGFWLTKIDHASVVVGHAINNPQISFYPHLSD